MAGLPFPCPIAARRLFAGRSGPYHEVRLGWEIGKANGPLRRLARNGPFPIVPPEKRQIAFFTIWSAMYSACRIARLTMVSDGFSDRKRVGKGNMVCVSGGHGGRRYITKNKSVEIGI